jgi:hypothetical protein
MSYRRPYSEEEQTDNSNVVERAETLNRISISFVEGRGEAIVTYPEALSEKSSYKKSVGEKYAAAENRRHTRN